jgi:hypothetical protein
MNKKQVGNTLTAPMMICKSALCLLAILMVYHPLHLADLNLSCNVSVGVQGWTASTWGAKLY